MDGVVAAAAAGVDVGLGAGAGADERACLSSDTVKPFIWSVTVVFL